MKKKNGLKDVANIVVVTLSPGVAVQDPVCVVTVLPSAGAVPRQ